MNNYWIGIAAGIFIGACFGFSLCALMVTAKRGDRQMEKGRQKAEGERLKAEEKKIENCLVVLGLCSP